MEVSALTQKGMPGLSGPSALLRLQSDERLIALTRRGQHAAFEVLFSRYQSRLLAFCRHMLGSREDAEDVLQEVFTAAFNAILADEREINVRPWLYRIARNRSLNHLRRASAIGVDSMDVHFADHGLSTGERVMRRESFRQLLGDVNALPETQRTALLLREIDALSYEQIAHAMETTVPSVKSLLVRARISLAEAAEARQLSCDEVRLQLGEAAEGLTKLGAPARRHVRGCERCRFFKRQLKANNQALAAIFPVAPLLMAKKLILSKLGSTASASSAHVGAGAGATASATATASAGAGAAAGAGGGAGGILTAGAGAVASKAVAGLAAAAIVTAGAVEAEHASRPAPPAHHIVASTYAPATVAVEPVVVHERVQPTTAPTTHVRLASLTPHLKAQPGPPAKSPAAAATSAVKLASDVKAATGSPAAAVKPATPSPAGPAPSAPVVTQVTSQTTVLPNSATSDGAPPAPEPQRAGSAESATGGTVAASETAPATQPAPASPAAESTAPATPPAETTTQPPAEATTQPPAATPEPEGGGERPATSSPDQSSTSSPEQSSTPDQTQAADQASAE